MNNPAAQTETILRSLRRHPRIVHQGLFEGGESLVRLKDSMPRLVPFPGATYHGFLPVLDWDHRLPSKLVLLRLNAFYSEDSLRAGELEFQLRQRQIHARDMFPEFDVPDFGGLVADEAYEVYMDPAGQVSQVTLTSEWRRELKTEVAREAVQIVRTCAEFQSVAGSIARADFLGDLEPRGWTPPCEGGTPGWTVDVLYLLEYNGVVG
jgi:hypothetical protein